MNKLLRHLPKAKELKPQIDKAITLGKKNNLHSKKNLFSELQSKLSVDKLTKILSARYEKRNGGYSRVMKAGFRYGDDAPMAIIELVDRDIQAKKVDIKENLKSWANKPKVELHQKILEKKPKSK